ncbi:MAG: hypothetical protein PF961_20920, partial [Planctomycetota bacterium]|nr:hypothetical protein [Planctomycetota bacterium]
ADQLAEHDAVLAADLAADEAAPAARRLPRPGMLLEAARDLGLDLVTSWFITADPALLKAAGQAACTGAVLIGADAPPAPILGLKIVAARDLADAPRVMVPDKGGCWHDHR